MSYVILLIAFLVGSIPFALWVARLFKVKDLASHGSRNMGATHVSRFIGFWPAGVLTFTLDVLKGALPVVLVAYGNLTDLLASVIAMPEDHATLITPLLIWSAGLFAVLGHCFSPWLHFKGGKGVATGFGVILVLSPISALVGLLGYIYCFFSTQIGSLSSLTGVALASVTYLVLNPVGIHVWAGAALIFVILIRHESNLDALLENREKSFV